MTQFLKQFNVRGTKEEKEGKKSRIVITEQKRLNRVNVMCGLCLDPELNNFPSLKWDEVLISA